MTWEGMRLFSKLCDTNLITWNSFSEEVVVAGVSGKKYFVTQHKTAINSHWPD